MVSNVFAIVNNEDAEKWNGSAPGLFIPFVQDFRKISTSGSSQDSEDCEWEVFNAAQGQLPGVESLSRYRAIFLTGSHYSCYEDLQWIKDEKEFVRQYYARLQAHLASPTDDHFPKLLGICFGHQLIAEALGGDVKPNVWPHGVFHFELGKSVVKVNERFRSKSYVRCALVEADYEGDFNGELVICTSHGDAVKVLPPAVECYGQSDNTEYEAYGIAEHVLCFQCHPELNGSHLTKLIAPSATKFTKTPEEFKASFEERNPDGQCCPLCDELALHPSLPSAFYATDVKCPDPRAHRFLHACVRNFLLG